MPFNQVAGGQTGGQQAASFQKLPKQMPKRFSRPNSNKRGGKMNLPKIKH